LKKYCYYNMFYGCTSLNHIVCLATNISASNCTTDWVNGVASTGTFVKDHNMTSWTTGNSGIPTGWAVEDYVEIVPNSLNSLVDVSTANPTSGQSLVYNGTNWVNQNVSGGGGASTLSGLTDTTISNPSSGQSLVYNGTNWVNQNVIGGGDELTSNKVTSISSASTDTQYPSAKCVYDLLGPIDTALNTILNGQSN
jgi:hypothetical protein